MLQTVWKTIDLAYRRIMGLFADPNDSDARRLQKNVMVTAILLVTLTSIPELPRYFATGEPLAAATAIVAISLVNLSLITYLLLRRYQLLYFSVLLTFLLLPFAQSLAFGGFANSSVTIVGSFFPTLVALLGDEPKKATPWFLGFVLIIVANGFLEPFVIRPSNFPLDVLTSGYVANLLIIMGLIFFFTRYFIGQKNTAYELLAVEREKSENLLLNILPREIAERLKNESGIIADRFDGVSILFADLVDFTPLSAQMAPDETVKLLNEIYSHFDSLADKYSVEKIRTIGDNYMVASGVPITRADHSQALANMALDMLDYSKALPARHGVPLDFRIGLNSGPLVAGVIGHKKFHYDVWGDTVNTASRMESHGLPGKIQITKATRDLLGDEFDCEPRGAVDIKGKGEMQTWFLVERA